jgi:tetratricopeptide (TPR) repeat protein
MNHLRHLRDREIQDLVADRLQPAARRRIARHLMAGCDACAARLQEAARGAFLPELGESNGADDAYDDCLDRVEAALPRLTAAWEDESKRRDAAVARVQAKGFGSLTSSDRRPFRGRWAEVEMLLELSFAARYRDRKVMLKLAESAQRAAERLTPSARYPAALLIDLQARAAAEVANAERVNERFLRAGEALEKARALADQGTGDLALQARLDEVEGTLRKDERSIAEADALLDRAQRAYKKLGEDHQAGLVLVTKGVSRFIGDDPREAVEIFRRAVLLLDPVRDPQLAAVAQHNFISALNDAGELGEASRLLLEGNLRQIFKDDPLNLLRLRWLEGKLLARRGRYANAERVLTEVRDGFRAQGLEYVAAVAGVDLAKVYLAQDKKQALHATATDLMTRARDRRLPTNAVQALRCFELTCEVGVAVERYAVVLQRFLQEAEHDPALPFEPEMMICKGS